MNFYLSVFFSFLSELVASAPTRTRNATSALPSCTFEYGYGICWNVRNRVEESARHKQTHGGGWDGGGRVGRVWEEAGKTRQFPGQIISIIEPSSEWSPLQETVDGDSGCGEGGDQDRPRIGERHRDAGYAGMNLLHLRTGNRIVNI